MIIKTNSHDVDIASVISTTIRKGGRSYPALKFVFDGAISAEDISALTSGSFSIGENVHEGYNTQGEISIVVGKITTAEEERDALQLANTALTADLNNERAKNAEYLENIEALEQENAELLFNNLTGEDYNEVIAE